MRKSSKFSPEIRERAVRMVQEHRGQYPSLWAAIESIAPKYCLLLGQHRRPKRAVILAQVGHFCFGAVRQFCIGGDTFAFRSSRLGACVGLVDMLR